MGGVREAGGECGQVSVQDGKARDAGMSEGVLTRAVSHPQQQQAEPSRRGRGLLGEALPGKSPDHRPCTVTQRELRKAIWGQVGLSLQGAEWGQGRMDMAEELT